IHDLGHLCLGNLEGVDSAFAHTMIVNMEHDAGGRFPVLLEEAFQDVNDELHRRVVVIQDQHAVETGLLCLGTGAGYDRGSTSGSPSVSPVSLHPRLVPHRGQPTSYQRSLSFRGHLTRSHM